MILRRIATFGGLLGTAAVPSACASHGPYNVHGTYTAMSTATAACPRVRPTYIVPELPAMDRLLGDLVVTCERHCSQQYAIDSLVSLAAEHGAARVSSLSCVQHEDGWICVGHASRTPLCEES